MPLPLNRAQARKRITLHQTPNGKSEPREDEDFAEDRVSFEFLLKSGGGFRLCAVRYGHGVFVEYSAGEQGQQAREEPNEAGIIGHEHMQGGHGYKQQREHEHHNQEAEVALIQAGGVVAQGGFVCGMDTEAELFRRGEQHGDAQADLPAVSGLQHLAAPHTALMPGLIFRLGHGCGGGLEAYFFGVVLPVHGITDDALHLVVFTHNNGVRLV